MEAKSWGKLPDSRQKMKRFFFLRIKEKERNLRTDPENPSLVYPK